MGRKILIYENGQTYEIDEEEIYIPKFEKDKKKDASDSGKSTNQILI